MLEDLIKKTLVTHLLYKNNNQAFTLVELSIVLVIIGLIISGVLLGQDLIRGAEARSIMSQLDKINAGVYAFRNKFAAIPGDFSNAASYLNGTSGDGNGLVYTGTPAGAITTTDPEMPQFWSQGQLAGVFEGSYAGTNTAVTLGNGGTANYPYLKNNRGGVLVYGNSDSNNYIYIGLGTSANTTIVNNLTLTPISAYMIDLKIDDGIPNTGTVRAYSDPSTQIAAVAAATTTCVVTGNTYYTIGTSTNYNCALRIQAGF